MKKKFVILFIGLLLPAVVFIFLKMFGRNEFDVPPLHSTSVEAAPVDCRIEYKAPYVVADSLVRLIGAGSTDLSVMCFVASPPKLAEIGNANREHLKVVEFQSELASESEYIRRCILIAPDEKDIVLLDRKGRIRGYYDSHDRDELDRLEAEVKIILKKY